MRLVVTSWNINSVRARIGHVLRHLDEVAPDVLCLQETKCPDDRFPLAPLRAAGYHHIAVNGQKGYHGVAVLSRLPFASTDVIGFCDRNDCRHIAVRLGYGAAAGVVIHNFYVPAGGDIPDPELNPKFAHKLAFLDEMQAWGSRTQPAANRSILVGDLNVAPYESDVWSHKALLGVVSHTPAETERLERVRRAAGFVDAVRHLRPEPERVFTWWSYRSPDFTVNDRGRRLDHVWLSADLVPALRAAEVDRAARSWERPSDHVPVTVTLQV
ncbi:exodeoxyribonuclease III [Chelatococcus reniformis]|uniref:Exodeoxyribonuclease III n=1 Tax=Chelatococcus reniformis TaxID=1494448 RepID=A0A916TYK4_9HYPH|nr:exodeoxyribonuclease III [Chelatococcus reniformis]GGC51497.1 exodeoxyribonuclease III [Chelatococcus reniformis]